MCSLVCDHEHQCEGHCVLGKKGAPVHFSVIENYISTAYSSKMVKGPVPSNGIRVTIGGALSIEDLLRDGYKAIFVGTGVWRPNTLKIKGESLGHVHYGINYLNNPDSFHIGERVIVIGAGNAAMDVARTVVEAVSQSKVVAEAMDRYLQSRIKEESCR